MNERPKLAWQELERLTRIQRGQPSTPTQKDIENLTRKKLGPYWGRRRQRGSKQ